MENYYKRLVENLRKKIDSNSELSIKEIAEKLGKSEKTIYNWLNHPDQFSIPLDKYIELCVLVKESPYDFFPESTTVDYCSRLTEPIRCEQMLLDLEKSIPPGQTKNVIFPFFSSNLLLNPVVERYVTKGTYQRKFLMEDARNEFFKIRAERRKCFEQGSYRLNSLIMRDDFIHFVNGDRLFKSISSEDRIAQLQHLSNLFDKVKWNGGSRLSIRMTKSYFRHHYALFQQPENKTILILNTNNGYFRISSPTMQAALQHEFSVIWENGTSALYWSIEQWKNLLDKMILLISSGEKLKIENFTF